MPHHSPRTVQVMNSLHEMVDVSPGFLDDAARHVYSSGQCLALAMAISSVTAEPAMIQLAPTRRGTLPVMVHAWVMTRGRQFIDINGSVSEDELNLSFWDGDIKFIVSAADLPEFHQAYADNLPPQDLDVARCFIDPVLELVRETSAARTARGK